MHHPCSRTQTLLCSNVFYFGLSPLTPNLYDLIYQFKDTLFFFNFFGGALFFYFAWKLSRKTIWQVLEDPYYNTLFASWQVDNFWFFLGAYKWIFFLLFGPIPNLWKQAGADLDLCQAQVI